MEAQKEILELTRELEHAGFLYYVKDGILENNGMQIVDVCFHALDRNLGKRSFGFADSLVARRSVNDKLSEH